MPESVPRPLRSIRLHPLPELTYDEWEAAPLADPEKRGCPNCGARYYSITHPTSRTLPGIYKCKGTEWPNAEDYEYQPPCGFRFRGIPGVHYDATFFAEQSVLVFLTRFGA